MLTMNYIYRIYSSATQQTELLEWLETCRGAHNYALRKLKDWIASRKCCEPDIHGLDLYLNTLAGSY